MCGILQQLKPSSTFTFHSVYEKVLGMMSNQVGFKDGGRGERSGHLSGGSKEVSGFFS